jgi:hypothetical protein
VLLAALLVVGAVALATGAGTAAAATTETVDQGVVQTVAADALTLRRLDGTSVTVSIGATTIVRVNGRRATIDAVQPGFVARVFHEASGPARLVRAVGTVTSRLDEGTVISRTAGALTIRTGPGTIVTVKLGLATVIQGANGRRLTRLALRPGAVVRVTSIPGRAADLVVVLPRA